MCLSKCVPVLAQFNCPVDINWDYMDGGLFRRFWAAHPEERAGAAPICDNILVFARGITTVRPGQLCFVPACYCVLPGTC